MFDGLDATTNVTALQAGWSVFPNPTSGQLTMMHADGHCPKQVQLFSADGRLFNPLNVNTAGGLTTVNIGHLAAGVYRMRWEWNGTVLSTPVHKIVP